ncbi:MAG: class I SAM-dependent methyltransferase [Anaerolineae bacterium]|nr:class I SAM-dependent methyltransferase [Anaerolineae bacterium]
MMTNSNPRTDPNLLTQEAYASDEHLSVRYRTHELYSRPKVNFVQWVLDALDWRGDEWVLDVGAGPGKYLGLLHTRAPNGRVIAGDLSPGMVRQAKRDNPTIPAGLGNFDAQRLPFRSNTFDVVLANHMLYHVRNLEGALAEISRVLKPTGCLLAATNSQDTMPELDTLARRACTLLGFPKQSFNANGGNFTLENGPVLLRHHFEAVARYDLPSSFHFPEVQPVLDYLNSTQSLRETQLPGGLRWDQFMDVMEKQITRLIRHFGELQVHKLAGVLVATNGGGFAAGYLGKLRGE